MTNESVCTFSVGAAFVAVKTAQFFLAVVVGNFLQNYIFADYSAVLFKCVGMAVHVFPPFAKSLLIIMLKYG